MSQFAYDYESHKLKKYNGTQIQEDGFTLWSKENFYRTSYINHFTEVTCLKLSIFSFFFLETLGTQKCSHSRLSRIYPWPICQQRIFQNIQ